MNQIQTEAIKIVNDYSSVIGLIALKIHLNDIRCPNCNYLQNKDEFKYILKSYQSYKRIYKFIKKGPIPLYLKEKLGIDKYITLHGAFDQYQDLQKKLYAIYPCKNCIIKFNPTNKEKYGKSISDNQN